ncbi:single-stranded-DNA-specific exonuclease RecJ [Fibrella aquatilis]|uniref:Single-stranded-DNA-specific exonuclease RecJ n=1 Tax=Fibrella aquatilis TaxID=2817059 RepID=A0A939GCA6_9BACT|nr:single-stranded-DNA-specific exonuclease RecJ [Fibrella aquatilis]MBO0934619.1 single-stranded-DNA-specific exonuclease RecJ [Fibrella aquatilis]
MITQPVPPSKRWLFKPFPDQADEQQAVADLVQVLNISPFLASLLVQRGVYTFDEARYFFRPELTHLHDPFQMRDMDRAVDRITRAMQQDEKILIYGDYDVDGTTSVSLMYGFLRTHYEHLDHYIPDRYKEGYGISKAGVQYAADNGFTLIIALDCGIKSIDRVAEASALGIDFIICDHHRPGDVLPAAVAVLDPKRADCQYPYKELTGCGVGFKLLQALCQRWNLPTNGLWAYLDLVVVSIACDIVPITGENRALAYYGLKRLNTEPRTGFQALMRVAGFMRDDEICPHKDKHLDIGNVVFGLGPRINAAGRIKHARDAVNLLLAETFDEAEEFAYFLHAHNKDRQDLDKGMTEQALDMIRRNDLLINAKSTVLYDASWHKGVIGIVASRCIEQFYRPTIILTQSNDKAAGSARSVAGFDVYEAIEECADLLEQFGGHTFAAGLTMPIENVDAFREKFERVVSEKILDEYLIPRVEVDLPLDFSEINDKFYRVMRQMSPFGPHNLAPVFCTEDVVLVGEPMLMKEKHVKFTCRQRRSGHQFTAVGFGLGAWADHLRPDEPFSICYNLEMNHFNNRSTMQLYLKDIKI